MSLCPNFCNCPVCPHGWPICEYCSECGAIRERERQQIEHLRSVARQKSRLKLIRRRGSADGREQR
jgi:hypothetical protein